ncbi:MAG: MFS family permease [Parasphingorhabdus sp.]|jgi:MFS family permease
MINQLASAEMKKNVLILSLCQALMLTGTSTLLATSALVGARLTPEPLLTTLPLALQFLGMMLSSFGASMLMKKIGRRAGFQFGLILALFGAAICASSIFSGSFYGFCLGSLLMGCSNGVGGFYRFAAADVATKEFKARAISYVLAGGVLAAFIGPNLANATRNFGEAEFAGSYAALLVVYLLSLVLISFSTIPAPSAEEQKSGGRKLSEIVRQPVFFVAAIGALVGYGVMNLVMSATPLAMQACGFEFFQTANVVQWHIVGMFAPSFFTGRLIERYGVLRIMFIGGVLLLAAIAINLHGITYVHFISALVFLGLGWNFLFIGGTTLLTEAYTLREKAKAQGLNDFIVSTTVTFTALSSGYLSLSFGWTILNQAAIPAVIFALLLITWLIRKKQSFH